ncbi:MAG: hypothetical protein WCT08_03340 [Patescibacteria group bacterium]|jgi:hypothetical protein
MPPIETQTLPEISQDQQRISVSEVEECPEGLFDLSEFDLPETDFEIPAETQQKIEALQESMQKKYEEAKIQANNLESLETRPEQERDVWKIEQEGDQLFYRDDNDERAEIDLMDITTDVDWGLRYYFDKSVSRDIRLAYLHAQTRSEMNLDYKKALLLQQIENPRLHENTHGAYERMLADMENGIFHFGEKIELAVKNFFKKAGVKAGFDVYDTNANQDVREYVDFIIANVKHLQEFIVKEDPHASKEIDIQFTVNDSPEKIWFKSSQLQKIKNRYAGTEPDVIRALIKMSGRDFTFFQNRWEAKKTPGGPDKAWRAGTKWTLFHQAMRKFLTSPAEIDAYWAMVNKKK